MKELVIEIGTNEYKVLKDNGYYLCIAKKVDDDKFNVIWQAYNDYSQSNKITWNKKYKIFASLSREDRKKVFANVSPEEISFGQEILLEAQGCFGAISQSREKDSIGMINQYQPVYPGLYQECTDIHGNTNSLPFYLSSNQSIPGSFRTKPVDKILVWFEQSVESGIAISRYTTSAKGISESTSIQLDMQEKSSMEIAFEQYQWEEKENKIFLS